MLRKIQKKRCRDIATEFSIGKTAAANVLKQSKDLRKEYELFKVRGKSLLKSRTPFQKIK